MFSSLSGGIRNAPFYDQAARTVACMAATIESSGKSVTDLESIGFYVLAPDEQIRRGIFDEQTKPESVLEKVQQRIGQYRKDKRKSANLQSWQERALQPMVQRMSMRCWAWENAVDAIGAAKPAHGNIVKEFYSLCLKYNQKGLGNDELRNVQ